jgi:hypothetical protein
MLVASYTPNTESVRFLELSVKLYPTTRRHIQKIVLFIVNAMKKLCPTQEESGGVLSSG